MAITRVIVTDPRLLGPDDSTGNLGADSESAVLNILSSLNREFQKTVVMVTHDPKAATHAKTNHYLEKGTMQRTEQGWPAEARSILPLQSQTENLTSSSGLPRAFRPARLPTVC